jgi:hypothetical protein
MCKNKDFPALGLASKMYKKSIQMCKNKHTKTYLVHVHTTGTPAVGLAWMDPAHTIQDKKSHNKA